MMTETAENKPIFEEFFVSNLTNFSKNIQNKETHNYPLISLENVL